MNAQVTGIKCQQTSIFEYHYTKLQEAANIEINVKNLRINNLCFMILGISANSKM